MEEDKIMTFISENLPDNSGEDVLQEVCQKVRDTFGVQCNYTYVGGFDSPGYDIYCYAIAYIKENGKPVILSHTREVY